MWILFLSPFSFTIIFTEEDFLYLTVQEKQQQQQHFHMWHMMINALFVPTKLKVEPYA